MTLFEDCFGDLSQEEKIRIAKQIVCINRIIGMYPQTIGDLLEKRYYYDK